MEWGVSDPTFPFTELRADLCGAAKFCFDPSHVCLFRLEFTAKTQKEWMTRTIE